MLSRADQSAPLGSDNEGNRPEPPRGHATTGTEASGTAGAASYPRWLRYGAAILLTAAVTSASYELRPIWDVPARHPYLIGWPIIIASAWFGGLGPGLVATGLSAMGILWLWFEPLGSFRLRHPSDLVAVALFVLCGVVVSLLIESLHRARAEERRLRRSREIVLGIVAHDLRNPLGTISLSSQVLRRRPGEVQRLDAIDRAIRRMDRLISDLVDASVIDNDMSLSMILSEEDVVPLVADAVAAVTPDLSTKGVRLVTELAPGLRARCDRERLLQALGNLLGNAVKFTPEGGQITVRAVSLDSFVRFEVSDNGPGIKPDHQALVFERNWTSGARSSAGLGLFITRGIAHAHGGRLWLHSEPGRGTTFFLTIPAARERPVSETGADESRRRMS